MAQGVPVWAYESSAAGKLNTAIPAISCFSATSICTEEADLHWPVPRQRSVNEVDSRLPLLDLQLLIRINLQDQIDFCSETGGNATSGCLIDYSQENNNWGSRHMQIHLPLGTFKSPKASFDSELQLLRKYLTLMSAAPCFSA